MAAYLSDTDGAVHAIFTDSRTRYGPKITRDPVHVDLPNRIICYLEYNVRAAKVKGLREHRKHSFARDNL